MAELEKTKPTRRKRTSTRTTTTGKKTPTRPRTAAKKTAKKAVGSRKKKAPAATITPEERHRLIAETAYYRAESRGFAEGSALSLIHI